MMISKVIDTVQQTCPNVQAIYLFGSFATADQTEKSDLDLAVLLPVGEFLPSETRFAADLARLAEREVDLIDLRNKDTVFQQEIILNGQRLFAQDESEVDAYELLVMSKYRHLNDERASIIESGLKTGFYK